MANSHSVCSIEGLTLETSAQKLSTMANFHYYIALLYSPTDAAPLTVSLETNPSTLS